MTALKTSKANSQPKPSQFQIWKEVDPRFERFVRVESVGVGRRSIGIRTVVLDDDVWVDGPRSRMSYADPERFQGQRGGYAIHQNF